MDELQGQLAEAVGDDQALHAALATIRRISSENPLLTHEQLTSVVARSPHANVLMERLGAHLMRSVSSDSLSDQHAVRRAHSAAALQQTSRQPGGSAVSLSSLENATPLSRSTSAIAACSMPGWPRDDAALMDGAERHGK